MTDKNREELSSFRPGDVVETIYGVGVIVSRPPESIDASDENGVSSLFYRVLLWRAAGRSIGSSSTASLRPEALLRKMPAAPGMITTKRESLEVTRAENDEKEQPQKYMVQAYYSDRQVYRIVPIGSEKSEKPDESTSNKDGDVPALNRRLSRLSIVMSASQLDESNLAIPEEVSIDELAESAPCAKFYPLLVQLIERGNKAASATKNFISDNYNRDEVKELKEQVTGVAKQATPYLKEQTQKIGLHLDKVKSTATTAVADPETQAQKVKDVVSDSSDKIALKVKQTAETEEVQQLMEMLKTEDLTVLLEKGKERLEQLLNDDIPRNTQIALEKAGVRIVLDDDLDDERETSMYKKTVVKSRKAALAAMQTVLDQANVNPDDVQAIQKSLSDNFGSMLDSWTEAAKSDRTLSGLLDTVNDQTAAWQEATGRLLNTRSAGIFLDGASRIQARAKNLFSKDQLQWAGEVGSKFTKAFTEGDAAVARLKSIELGDSVRDRLVSAIEVRSESLGGLDGIIAGALTAVNQNVEGIADKVAGGVQKHAGPGEDGDHMQKMLTNLQSRASSLTADSNETLISVLARQNQYRDVALLKVEQVMCDLDSHFGEDLSAEDIASIAQGEGGTAKLFDPIAKRAAKEIEKQLDSAESSVSDPTILEVLQHVRKIVSGELTVSAVLDEVVNVLNDDKVVAVGENLVKHGEKVLDAIEGVNGNKVVDDAMRIAEKAGITKDTVMEGIEAIDVNELLDNAGNAITDEKARQKLLSDATDTALDFILKVLPSMPVPPVEGVKDGLVYKISNLSMEGFKVRKENIIVEIAGMRATKRVKKKSPVIQEVSEDDAPVWLQVAADEASSWAGLSRQSSSDSMDFETTIDENVVVNATELLIIDVSDISALMNDVNWSFEQTYMPYLKGSGKFDVNMSGGAIRLVFELRKRPKKDKSGEGEEWEPVLCLHDRLCSIGSVDFNMHGGSKMAWVINKVASVFKNLLRDYVVRAILQIMTEKSGWILSKLNQGLSPFWDVLLRTAKLELGDLEVATKESIVEASPEPDSTLVELVWREHLPLGMNLLLNDESGQLKIVDFPRGSQARTVCEARKLDPEGFKGATIVAVNGIRYQTEDELFDALRDPSRPKTIQFELAESEDAERIRKFVEESEARQNPDKSNAQKPTVSADDRDISTREVDFTDDMDLGLEFANAPDNVGLVVRKFLESEDGLVLAAERKKDKIHVGDLLTHVNGKLVIGENGAGRRLALKLIESEGKERPLRLTFADPYLHPIVYEQSESLPFVLGGPEELVLKEDRENKRIVLDGFKEVDGVSEKGGVLLGDHLVFVNGVTVGAGCRWMGERSSPTLVEVDRMLRDKSNYPIGLTFARPKRQNEAQARDWTSTLLGTPTKKEIQMENSDTICVSADSYEQLGLDLELKTYSDIIVKDLKGIVGPLQLSTQRLRDPQNDTYSHLSVDYINGEFVPSFATPHLVKSAMERSWKTEKQVEVIFCDNDMKKFVLNLKDQDAN
ncbi:unnamed protein product [Pseudo-nitzschia multistriata]|uniref:PDZ domain-containing protein n=1 Tax=Pseudo-nitzschia multistriata TaxID=183589 RepID=A0A448Z622_9STRA|nr:unnamed protein product [Pseudo-nitzschia multistriata]